VAKMETIVTCVKVKNIRPQYQNLREWMDDSQNVYIGRKGIVFIDGERFPKKDSIWANPYKIGPDGTREEVLEKYRAYIIQRINLIPSLKNRLLDLRGKRLGCWCHSEACHGDILIEIMNILIKEIVDEY
jgi:hypothetical protein